MSHHMGLYILSKDAFNKIYSPQIRSKIESKIKVFSSHMTVDQISENVSILSEMTCMFTGWGCPVLDEYFLESAYNLEMVFYGAGSVKNVVTDAFWEKGCRITSAAAANGVPVAQYLLSQIIFCLKSGWQQTRAFAATHNLYDPQPVKGFCPGRTVGILSLGVIGRLLVSYLKPFGLNIIAYDPYVHEFQDAEMVGLKDIFRLSDIVVCCTPVTPDTIGMITGEHFAMMKNNSTFVNTARGIIIRENEMIDVLRKRPEILAVLDVTYPEPPRSDSPLWTMGNVVLTPHIAGSMGCECERLGLQMTEELNRYILGESLKYEITQNSLPLMA